MQSILYIMGESWYWIKQRPHFFAEYLSEDHHIDLVFEKRYTKRVENPVPPNIKCHEIFKLPKTHNPVSGRINNVLIKKQLKKIICGQKHDIILINNYKHFNLINDYISPSVFVVYDCMDDFLEFEGSKRSDKVQNEIFNMEKALYTRSNLVIFSSEYLKRKLFSRYYEKDNTAIINNAIDLNFEYADSSIPGTLVSAFRNEYKNICYIGSVSDWFDFSLILKTLEKYQDVNVVIVGPSDVKIPDHDRLFIHPQIPHSNVIGVMKKADLLVMPFVVNELVRSVNPVKVYEYIYSCVPTAVVNYGETSVFKDFVYLYDNEQEFFDIVERMLDNKLSLPVSEFEAIEFAEKNT